MTDGIPFTILVVDDDEDDRMIMDEAFGAIGYAAEVKKFIDGAGLLQYLGKIGPSQCPSLIVLDNTLPVLSAADILTTLKNTPANADIPVVVYTTSLSESKRQELMELGAEACYQKGSTMAEVVTLVTRLKARAESQQKGSANSNFG